MTYTQSLLRDELVRDEGYKRWPYKDTVGKATIGIGFNLDDVGLYAEEIDFIFRNRVRMVEEVLDAQLPWWRSLSDARQRALVNMAYNMGWGTLSQFKNLLAALQAGDWDRAADSALHSLWASQVGARAQRIATLIREG